MYLDPEKLLNSLKEDWLWILIGVISSLIWILVWILIAKWASKKNYYRTEKVCYVIATGFFIIVFIGLIIMDPAFWFGSSKDDDFDDY